MGSLQAPAPRAGAGIGACYGASREICRRSDESDWHGASPARSPCGLLEARQAFAGHFEFLRRIQTISSQPINNEEEYNPDTIATRVMRMGRSRGDERA